MWFFGFSTTNPRHVWVIAAIILVILLPIILRKLVVFLIAKDEEDDLLQNGGDGDDHEKNISRVDYSSSFRSKSWGGDIRTFGLDELRDATRDFGVRIGVGATSFVYLAVLEDGRLGAIKRVMEDRGGSRKMFLDEVSVLVRISHPNLVGLMGVCMEKGEQLLVLEYVPSRSLFERMHTHKGQSISGILSWSNRLSIALDIAQALDYLHSQADPPIVHRDVKSSNVLLMNDNRAKLGDFGLCKLGYDHIMQVPSAVKGSFGYTDTNYMRTGRVTSKSDVYSFGVLLLELITGLKSHQGSVTLADCIMDQRTSENVGVRVGILDPKLNSDANMDQFCALLEIANSALVENSEARPTMSHIVYRLVSCMELQFQAHLPV